MNSRVQAVASNSTKALAMLALLATAAMLSGCNTTAGAGQDLSASGHAVTNTAEKVKSGL